MYVTIQMFEYFFIRQGCIKLITRVTAKTFTTLKKIFQMYHSFHKNIKQHNCCIYLLYF